MKREWYSYTSAVKELSGAMVRDRLPASLRRQLLTEPHLSQGINADATNIGLVADLDRVLEIGKTTNVLRTLNAEVDSRSIGDYELFLVSFLDLAVTSKSDHALIAKTPEEYLERVQIKWPQTSGLRVRELYVRTLLNRLFLVSTSIKELFESEGIEGARFYQVREDCWRMEVISRVSIDADALLPRTDYDAATQSVVGLNSFFGVRYERSNFDANDVQLIDRIFVGTSQLRFRMPWLVVSRKLVQLCVANKIDQLKSANIVFRRGLVPLLLGRGQITSTLEHVGATNLPLHGTSLSRQGK